MRYHNTGSPPHNGKSRPEAQTPKRLRVPNLAVWSDLDSIERRKLQLIGEALIRAYEVHRHIKQRREEANTLGNLFRSGGAR